MSQATILMSIRRAGPLTAILASVVFSPLTPRLAAAGREPVARCVTDSGSILRREAPGKPWQVVAKDETLYSGDELLGLPGAALQAQGGKVRLGFRADLTGDAPLPILETVVVLHAGKDDLDFTLDRGRAILTNTAKDSPARVRLHVRDKSGEIDLNAPGTRLDVEMFGRWAAGTRFTKDAKPGHEPILYLVFLALKGSVDIKTERRQLALSAPPGPALLEWDSVTGADATPKHLDKLPDWVSEDDSAPAARAKKARIEEFRKLAVSKSIPAAVQAFLESDDPAKRRGAVFLMGATDDLRGLGNALANTKHLDVWDSGVIALRHWIGRGPGQDQKLYNGLIEQAKFRPVDAAGVLQLLHGFSDADLADPATYEALIDYLEHERLALRGLAYWHLYRLVPAGRELGYNPLDPKEKRQKAVQQWRKLVPAGQLPPKASRG